MIDIAAQCHAVRNDIGLIDRSDSGKIAVSGEDRFSWLQGMVSNDVQMLQNGQSQRLQACLLDATGHIISDMAILCMEGYNPDSGKNIFARSLGLEDQNFLLLDLPKTNVAKVLNLLERYIIMEDVALRDVSESIACFSFQGASPFAAKRPLGFGHKVGIGNIIPGLSVGADHTGSGGFDFYFMRVGQEVLQEGFKFLVNPERYVGEEAQEILRVEAGIPKYGVDMDETTLAPEAGLMETHISLTKGCYVGQEIVARIHSRGHTNRALTGLVFADGDAPASGDKIVVEEDGKPRETGRITSIIAASPAMYGRPIALGYVRHEHRAPGNSVQVVGSDRTRPANVVELPFYKPSQQGDVNLPIQS